MINRISYLVLVLVSSGLLFGCTASKNIVETQSHIRSTDDFRTVDVDSVSTFLENYRRTDEDEVLYHLEYASLYHYREQWNQSSKHFTRAERAIEQNYSKSINRNLQAWLVNDLQLAYDGEAYEDVYINVFNSLNYLHRGDTQGALVEARRVVHKLDRLSDRYKGLAASLSRDTAQVAVEQADEEMEDVNLLTQDEQPAEIQQNSALGRFLTTVLYGKTGSSDDAEIELQNLRTALDDQGRRDYLTALARADEPASAQDRPVFPTFWTQEEWSPVMVVNTLLGGEAAFTDSHGGSGSSSHATPSGVSVPSPDDLSEPDAYNAALLCFTGRAPKKTERSFNFPIIFDEEEVLLSFAVPVLESSDSEVKSVRAIVADDTVRVPLIEDMQKVAEKIFDQKKSILYTRAVIRAFIKAGATEGAASVAEDELGDVAGFVTERAGEAMSWYAAQADTRGWQTMPGFAHAVVAKLPPGTHDVTFEFLSSRGTVLKRRTQEVTVTGPEDFAVAESIYLR